jgi:hypothetical protein
LESHLKGNLNKINNHKIIIQKNFKHKNKAISISSLKIRKIFGSIHVPIPSPIPSPTSIVSPKDAKMILFTSRNLLKKRFALFFIEACLLYIQKVKDT